MQLYFIPAETYNERVLLSCYDPNIENALFTTFSTMNLIIKMIAAATMSGGPYNYNYIFKYIIIGDMGVGKSCILHQFTEKKCK